MYFAASDRKCLLLPPPFNPVRRWMGHGGKIHLGHRNEIGDMPIWMYQAMTIVCNLTNKYRTIKIKNVAPTNMADGYMIWLYNNSACHHVDT